MEVQRYPADFDGVVAGASVINNTANNTIFHAWSAQHLQRSDGPLIFSPRDLQTLHDAALEQCDAADDGVKDGVIGNPMACRFDPAVTLCREGKSDACLSAEQVAAAKALYTGPQNASGDRLYYGRAVGSELMWGGPEVATYARSFITHMSADTPQTFDLASITYDAAALARYNQQAPVFNAMNPDIRAFQRAGGKLILWHGWGDPGVPPMSSVDYYRSVRRAVGAGTDDFVRLYMLPGVGHCAGGEGPDRINLIDPIMAWVEDGIAPGSIEGSRKAYGRVLQKRPVYPFPAIARYRGTGDANQASSFVETR
jgi:feruloyl esterase